MLLSKFLVITLAVAVMTYGYKWRCKPTQNDSLCKVSKDPEVCYPDDDYEGMFRSCFEACQNTKINSIYDEDCKRKCPGYLNENCNKTVSKEIGIVPAEKTGYTETITTQSDGISVPDMAMEMNIDPQTTFALEICLPLGAISMISIILTIYFLYRRKQENKLKAKKDENFEEEVNKQEAAKKEEKKHHDQRQAILGQGDDDFTHLIERSPNQAQAVNPKAKLMCTILLQPVDDQNSEVEA